MKAIIKKARFMLLIGLLGVAMILSGCGKEEEGDIYTGGGDPGDFYTITISNEENTYSYTNLTDPDVSGSGEFTSTSTPRLYKLDLGNYFVMLPEEILAAQVAVNNEPRLVVAVKQALNAYGMEIQGDYHWIDLFGVVGEATVVPDAGSPSTGHITGSSSYGNFDADYTFYDDYMAVHIVETEQSTFPNNYGYGVFIDNDVCILDFYEATGEGTGINVAVKKLTNPDIATYAGTYVYLDKFGGHGTYTIMVTGNAIDSIIYQGVDDMGNPDEGTIPGSDITDNGDGSITFLLNSDTWHALLLPGKVIVAGSEESSGVGILLVGLKQD